MTLACYRKPGPVLRALIAVVVALAAAVPVAVAGDSPAVPMVGRPDYPLPPASDKLLFFLQRSNNSNTVVYEANLRSDGKLDPENPVRVYWLRFNTDGRRKPLSYLERTAAFGVVSRPADDGQGYVVHLVSYDKRPAYVSVGADGKPRATLEIAGRPAVLRSAYIEVEDGGLKPSVVYADLYGEDLATGEPLHERFVP